MRFLFFISLEIPIRNDALRDIALVHVSTVLTAYAANRVFHEMFVGVRAFDCVRLIRMLSLVLGQCALCGRIYTHST